MNIFRKTLPLFLIVIPFFNNAGASLIEVDLYNSGDGLITRDTDTGLDWLDLTSTLNISYDEMLTEIAVGGQFEDYRYATIADVDRLQESAGLPTGLFFTTFPLYTQRVNDLMDMVGITKISGGYIYSYGLTGDPFLPTSTLDDRMLRGFSITGGTSALQGVVGDAVVSSTNGSWLIRDTPAPVPVPNALILFMSGLAVFVRKINMARIINNLESRAT